MENEKSTDALVSFLYEVLRDHIVPGTVEKMVKDIESHSRDIMLFSNPHVARYAKELAQRIQLANTMTDFGPLTPTEYMRPDKVSLIRMASGQWAIRDIRGPAWFWNFIGEKWCHVTEFANSDVNFTRPFDEAIAVFKIVPKTHEWEGSKFKEESLSDPRKS